ncbi:MAG: hypothetical protein M9904_12765 [Chitinophagaceae bacterium]|nr:hypothetical protein [Chitinophagaceae bacterium]
MKKIYNLILGIIILIAGCEKANTSEDDNPSDFGEVIFWIGSDFGCGPITVNCGGDTKLITHYSTSGASPVCGSEGYATFSLLPGEYDFVASCSGKNWKGKVNIIKGKCYNMQLTTSGSTGETPGTTDKGGLQILFGLGHSTASNTKRVISANIEVFVEGIKRGTITSPYSSTYSLPYSSPGDCSHNSNNGSTVFYTGDAGKQVTITWSGTLNWEMYTGGTKLENIDITQRITLGKNICRYAY